MFTILVFIVLMFVVSYVLNWWFFRPVKCVHCTQRELENRSRHFQRVEETANLDEQALADEW